MPALGLRVRWAPVSNWFIQAGVYDGDCFDSPTGDPRVNNRGLRYELNREQGAFSIYETGFSWNSSDDSAGLPGDVRVGGWQHTHVFDDNYRDANGDSYIVTGLPPLQHKGIWGVYLGVDQMLWREGDEPGQREQGLGMFARGGYTPRNRSFVEFVFDGGFDYVGLLPGRDEDEFGVLFVYAPVSRDIARRERDDAAFNGTSYTAFASYEFVFEVTYRCVVTPWCIVQPDLQWIHKPGGSSALEDALLFGLRSTLTF
jgi:porin